MESHVGVAAEFRGGVSHRAGSAEPLKPIRWSSHALKNLADREIPRPEAEKTLASPEVVVPGDPARRIFMRRYQDTRLGQEMLMRAVVEEKAEEMLVITVYITSKISKYLKGTTP